MRSAFLACLIVFAFPVQAALVDNDWYTTDTSSGLNWLDLSATRYLSMNEALAANPTWRFASNAEVEDLFNQIFPNFVPGHEFGFTTGGGIRESFDGQWAGADLFHSLFGPVQPVADTGYTYGLYYDEDNIARMMGVYGASVYGLEFTNDYSDYVDDGGHSAYGTYLVSTTAVPVPAAAWLFGSALAGLGIVRRRRANRDAA